MKTELVKRLEKAQGRSEFIIAVVCDIRGFSSFSTQHESPDTAMFVKRFYLKLLTDYFSEAVFAKPTGDGLLMVFSYAEDSLHQVSEYVLSSCFRTLADFPRMFESDPMINYKTPENLAFGVSRGTACCLYSRASILDYSGQLLNLASRLNDLARPRGIVIDGGYLMGAIPKEMQSQFTTQQVYVRSIAEQKPIAIYFSSDVRVPSYALSPIASTSWRSAEMKMSVKQLLALKGRFTINLPTALDAAGDKKMEIVYPNPTVKGYLKWNTLKEVEDYTDAIGHHVRFQVSEAQELVRKEELKPKTALIFRFHYVPKLE